MNYMSLNFNLSTAVPHLHRGICTPRHRNAPGRWVRSRGWRFRPRVAGGCRRAQCQKGRGGRAARRRRRRPTATVSAASASRWLAPTPTPRARSHPPLLLPSVKGAKSAGVTFGGGSPEMRILYISDWLSPPLQECSATWRKPTNIIMRHLNNWIILRDIVNLFCRLYPEGEKPCKLPFI